MRLSDHAPASLLERIAEHAAVGRGSVRIMTEVPRTLSLAELWGWSGECAAALAARGVGPGMRVALGMSTSAETIALVIAIARLGATLIPLRHRGYLRTGSRDAEGITAALRAGRPRWCLAERGLCASLDALIVHHGLVIDVLCVEELLTRDPSPAERPFGTQAADVPMLLQFSSGSTSAPRGICLTALNVAANVAAICERVDLNPSDKVVSWLPLYHDMGLVGVVFCTLYVGGRLVLMPPEDFVRDPLSWIVALSTERATATVAPQFAYTLALRKSRADWARLAGEDLSALRLALNGAETLHWGFCQEFQTQFGRLGLRPHTVQPAYGLAENCVSVSVRVPGTAVPVRRCDRAALADGRMQPLVGALGDSATLVGTGPPIRGTEVSIRDADGTALLGDAIGHICIRGSSATSSIADAAGELHPVGEGGWIDTGDMGALVDGELFIVGRSKEIFKHGGRIFAPPDIEQALEASGLAPCGGAAAFSLYNPEAGAEELVLVLEHQPRDDHPAAVFVHRARLLVLHQFQLPVRDVVTVRRGTIPRTSSGKIKRTLLRQQYSSGAVRSAPAGPVSPVAPRDTGAIGAVPPAVPP